MSFGFENSRGEAGYFRFCGYICDFEILFAILEIYFRFSSFICYFAKLDTFQHAFNSTIPTFSSNPKMVRSPPGSRTIFFTILF